MGLPVSFLEERAALSACFKSLPHWSIIYVSVPKLSVNPDLDRDLLFLWSSLMLNRTWINFPDLIEKMSQTSQRSQSVFVTGCGCSLVVECRFAICHIYH